jgi:chromate reductase, NAD(P)H dehydrogenase (quinone)
MPGSQEVTGMTTIVGFSGSLRRDSFNAALLRTAKTMMPADSTLAVGSIAAFSLYNGDDEAANGIPAAVKTLKDAIAVADGLLLVTPEYNNSVPGVAKNAIDWLSRPASDIERIFGGKPVGVIGASPGRFGTILSQNAWLPVFRTLGADLWAGGRLMVASAGSVFDSSGKMTDERSREALKHYLEGFVAYARKARRLEST